MTGTDHEHAIRDDFMRSLPSSTPEEVKAFLWREVQPNADQVRQAQVAAMFEDNHLSPAAIRASKNDPEFFTKLGLTEPTEGWEFHSKMPVKAKDDLGVPGTVKWMDRWYDGEGTKVSVHYHQRPPEAPHFGEPVGIKVKVKWSWGNKG